MLLADKPPTLKTDNVTESNFSNLRQLWWIRKLLLTQGTKVSEIENTIVRLRKVTNEKDSEDPAKLDAPFKPVISDDGYTKLVQDIGSALNKPDTARLGRPALSHADIEALYASLCGETFLNGTVLIHEDPTPVTKELIANRTLTIIVTSEGIRSARDVEDDFGDTRASADLQDPNDNEIELI
ncbi:Helicase C-terminal [Penicillium sp. IBT 18751x]|nr:Helicase C-terminal [Penicillium sp. IBT 18751x]